MVVGVAGLLADQRRQVLSILFMVPMLVATARSGLPSALRSAAVTEEEVCPWGK
jgi:hypothetical protein